MCYCLICGRTANPRSLPFALQSWRRESWRLLSATLVLLLTVLAKANPSNTNLDFYWLPTIQVSIDLDLHRLAQAIEKLQAARRPPNAHPPRFGPRQSRTREFTSSSLSEKFAQIQAKHAFALTPISRCDN